VTVEPALPLWMAWRSAAWQPAPLPAQPCVDVPVATGAAVRCDAAKVGMSVALWQALHWAFHATALLASEIVFALALWQSEQVRLWPLE
jgi:hypothetical protein